MSSHRPGYDSSLKCLHVNRLRIKMNLLAVFVLFGCQIGTFSWDFEDSSAEAGWSAKGCDAEQVTDSFTGNYSLQITNRESDTSGIYFDIPIEPSTAYYFQANIKLLNTPSGLSNEVFVKTKIISNAGSTKETLGRQKYMQDGIWQEVGGDFITPSDALSLSVFLQIPNNTIDYLIDTVNIEEIQQLSSTWRDDADKAIKELRTDIITISTSGNASTSGIRIKLQQDKSEFPFGSSVSAELMVDPDYKSYQDFFYDTFEWGVLANKLKWKQMEKTQGVIDHDTALNAMNDMLAKGITLRAHNVFWGIEKNAPTWIKTLPNDQIKQLLVDRINDIIPATQGLVKQWDVNNENLHGNYYAEKTGEVNLTMWMFQEINKLDPSVKLYLNDYGVVNGGLWGEAYYNQAMMFKNTPDVPIHGIGIQSHLKVPVDISILKFRLDRLARVGLPLWITEFDVSNTNETAKAEYLEDVLRLYFSHPAVEGIIFWGFWIGKISKPEVSLAIGPPDNVQANEAGQRMQYLLKTLWRTKANRSLDSGAVRIRAFRGDYTMTVKQNTKVVHTESFTLMKGGKDFVINLSDSDSGLQVTVN